MVPQRTVPSAGEVLASVPADPAKVRSLYIHVPFCFHKCHYCDFYSLVDTQSRQESFVTRLEAELSAWAEWTGKVTLETVFVGGGTPSLLAVPLWERLLRCLADRFDLARMGRGDGEFTVECNPETVTRELMNTLAGGGVNRVSVGAQSFDPRHLKTLERWHDPRNVARAVDLARAAGIGRASIDLIFAIPGQTLDDWRSDLDEALALQTGHLSCYALTYEPKTALFARRARGEVTPVEEDLEADMFGLTLDRLRAAGLDRYEVSNFARPGAECRHNLAYWRQESWMAAGPSASAHVAGYRWKNVARLDDYLSSATRFSPIVDLEHPDGQRELCERIMTGLRLREGLDPVAVLGTSSQIDPAAPERILEAARRAVSKGHLQERNARWSLTDSGFLIADAVIVDFFTALDRR